jgi:hypothetical protein
MDAIHNKTRSGGNYPEPLITCNAALAGTIPDQYGGKICWHPGIRAVCMPLHEFWYVYLPDTGVMSIFPRQDGRFSDYNEDVNGNSYYAGVGQGPWLNSYDTFFDPATNDLITYDTIDFNAPQNESLVPGWYRNHFTLTAALPAWTPAVGTVAVVSAGSGAGVSIQAVYNANVHDGPWNTGSGVSPLVTAWNSACYAPACGTLGSLVFVGGGDGDYWGNEVYVYDVASQRWRVINLPSVYCATTGTFNYGNATYQDGTPGTGHTYGCVWYLSPALGGGSQGSVMIIIRTDWYRQSAAGSNVSFRCDLATGVWSQASSNAATYAQEQSWAFDSLRNRYLGINSGSGSVNQDVVRALGSFSAGMGVHSNLAMATQDMMAHEPTCCYAPNQDALLAFGWTGTVYGIRAWAAGTMANSDLTLVGDALPQGTGLGFQWCPDTGGFFLRNPTPGQEQLLWHVVPPETSWQSNAWTVQKITMAGVAVAAGNPSTGANGLYGQFQYVQAVKCLMWCHDVNHPVYAYRVAA